LGKAEGFLRQAPQGRVRRAPSRENKAQRREDAETCVRSTRDPSSILSAVVGAVHEVDPDQPVVQVRTMEEVLQRSLAYTRFTMLLLAAFAGLALLLAAVGICSVLSYAVRRRLTTAQAGSQLMISSKSMMHFLRTKTMVSRALSLRAALLEPEVVADGPSCLDRDGGCANVGRGRPNSGSGW